MYKRRLSPELKERASRLLVELNAATDEAMAAITYHGMFLDSIGRRDAPSWTVLGQALTGLFAAEMKFDRLLKDRIDELEAQQAARESDA